MPNTQDTAARPAVKRRNTSSELREGFECRLPKQLSLSIVVLGASGDLAKKKTFPALFQLFHGKFLPKRLQIIGYARTGMTSDELRKRLRQYLKGDDKEIDSFLELCSYKQGEYEPSSDGYPKLEEALKKFESGSAGKPASRLFYLALPPNVYPQVCKGLHDHCGSVSDGVEEGRSWVRVVVEKPFGKDTESSEILASQLGELFDEEALYRIDHYLGKELAQNMLVLRFANPIFGSWWNRMYVSNVQITFKEDFGTQGRGGYFDQYGIIRDVLQNHLIQVMSLLTMEQPVSMHPDDIRDEKLKVLRCVPPVRPDECLLGQYTAANGEPGYLDDDTVPKGSKTPTFAACKLFINNDRWAGVPFILKAGKALNEKIVVVRMQLKSAPVGLFGSNLDEMRNELVLRFQPGEAIYAKLVVKKPGLDMDTEMSELDLSYTERYHDVTIPDAYERLILDCIRGDQQHFVRRDELRAAWAIFTPLLHAIDAGEIPPEPYPVGSRGPASQDAFLAAAGFKKGSNYIWRSPAAVAHQKQLKKLGEDEHKAASAAMQQTGQQQNKL